jgi:hypothetical protein
VAYVAAVRPRLVRILVNAEADVLLMRFTRDVFKLVVVIFTCNEFVS